MDKKLYIKRAVSVVSFIAILCLVLYRVYEIVSWKDTEGDYSSTMTGLYSTPKDTMELVFVGSSHCYGGIDTEYFWSNYGIPAFNMCCSGQDKDSAYHQLKELLKTQSPQMVVVEAYAFLFERQEHIGNAYRNMLSMDFSKNSNELIRKYVEKENQLDYLLRWPIVHTRYRELQQYDFVQYEPSVFGRGHTYNLHTEEVGFDANIFYEPLVTEISDHNKEWIDELDKLSKEEGFDLMFVQIPSDVSSEQQYILNGCEEYLNLLGIPYLDLNKRMGEIGLNPKADFIDFNHVNYYGAEKTTEYLANYLMENYYFEPHDGEDEYELWDKSADYSYHFSWASELAAKDMGEYLKSVIKQKDVITVLTLDGWYSVTGTDWATALSDLKLREDPSKIEEGGTWIFRDGKLIAYIPQGEEQPQWALDINDTDTMVIKNYIRDTKQVTGIYINDEIKCGNNDGLNVLVYDEVMDKVVNTRHFD